MSSPRYDWWGYVKAFVRRYPSAEEGLSGNAQREKEAVRRAVDQTKDLPDGEDRLRLVQMVFWDRTHTLSGAAMAVPCSERTARRWHADFIRTVAKNYGLLP